MTAKRILPVVGIVAAFLLGLALRDGGDASGPAATPAATAAADSATAEATIWTCAMHPQIRLHHPGKCPICFMDLIPLKAGLGADEGPRTLVMTAAAAALADVRTAAVERRPAHAEVRLIGTVVPAETRTRTITSRVAGRLDTLFVDFTGTAVRRGEPLASIYSPELVAAQTELLSAVQAARALGPDTSDLMRSTTDATVTAARRRLHLWGLDDDQIAAVQKRGTAGDHLQVRATLAGVVLHKDAVEGMYVKEGTPLYTVADLGKVWVEMEAYESQLPYVHLGQDVTFTAPALPGRELAGRVVFVDPVLSDRKRTVRLRLEADNADGMLKPGMYVHAVVAAPVGGAMPLVIPATAPLITGKRAVVYVKLPDREHPTFVGREVVLGPRAGDVYVVDSGLAEGDQVVVKGNFKIDSALQIQAKPSMMSPAAADSAPPQPPVTAGTAPAPPAFRRGLDRVLTAYLDLQRALAGDDDAAAARAAAATAAALDAVPADGLASQLRATWVEDRGILARAAAAAAAAGDIDTRRRAFEGLSDALWRALEHFGTVRTEPVRRFHCPMAFASKGADWLQLPQGTLNPYFGSAMLQCGSQTDSLTAAEGGR